MAMLAHSKVFSLALIITLTLLFGVGTILVSRAGRSVQNAGDDLQNIAVGATTPTARSADYLTSSVRAVEPSTTEPPASMLLPPSRPPPIPTAFDSTELLNMPEASPPPSTVPL